MEQNNISSGSGTIADSSSVDTQQIHESPFRPSTAVIAAVAGVIVVIAGAIIFFVTRKPQTTPPVDEAGLPVAETVYSTPEGTEDAEADYIKHLEKQQAAAKTPDEELYSVIDKANLKIMLEKYDEAQEILDDIDTSELSDAGLHQLYTAYVGLYSPNALDDAARFAEYEAKVEAQRKILIGESSHE